MDIEKFTERARGFWREIYLSAAAFHAREFSKRYLVFAAHLIGPDAGGTNKASG